MTLLALVPSALDDVPAMRHHLRTERVVDAPAERVFAVLAGGEGQHRWAPGYRGTRWYGGSARGVGTVRDVHLLWITVRERFLAWEPGARFAFSADAMSVPLARRLVEDIAFTPLGPQRCRMTWEVHLTPAPVLGPAGPRLVERVFAPMFAAFAEGLARYSATTTRT